VPKLKQHLTEFLIFAPEQQRYHHEALLFLIFSSLPELIYFVQIVPLLLHAKLISVSDFDTYLAKMVAGQSRFLSSLHLLLLHSHRD
jgi:hypothetical protein